MAKRFEIPVLVAALLVIPVIVIEESEPIGMWRTVAVVGNWAIWLVFAAELVAMLAVSRERWGYVREHPLEVAVVLLTPPFAPPAMQAARIFRLLRLLRLGLTARRLRAFFTLAGLRYATVVAAFGILAGGAAFAAVEQEQDLSAWDGVYWAITTITTVGYGDVLPETESGKIIAITIMLLGISYAAILTAALAQQFLVRIGHDEAQREDELLACMDELSARLARLEEVIR